MAAGLGYIEFATGDVLTAAAANGYLASQVVMVFADAAARTSGITSPQEGMITYLKDTNATQYYSGSAWVDIAGAAAASGLTLIAKSSASGAASHTVSNCFTSTYEKYRVVYQFSSFGAANNDLTLQLTVAGTPTTSGYSCQRMMVNGSSTGFSSNPYGTDEWDFIYGGSSYPASTFGAIEFGDPQKASVSTYTQNGTARSGSTTFFFINGGMLDNSTQYDGFKVVGTGGNFSADFYIYGYQKS